MIASSRGCAIASSRGCARSGEGFDLVAPDATSGVGAGGGCDEEIAAIARGQWSGIGPWGVWPGWTAAQF